MEELEARLGAPDAIMEPTAKATLRSFLLLGGGAAAAERAVDLLSSRYRGYAQMTSLVCRWLEETDAALPAPRPPQPAAAPAPSYEWRFAEALVRKRFDGRVVDEGIERLRAQGSSPAWFVPLLSQAPGRALLFSLAERHSCKALSMAIKFAWSQGHVEEVARLGASLAAASFDIFHGVLRRWLDDFAAAPSAAARDEAVAALRALTSASPAALLFAQMLLNSLQEEPGGLPLRRLGQELAGAAEAARGAALLRPFPALLAPAADAAAAAAAADLCAAVERMSSRVSGADAQGRPGALSAAERLAAHYAPPPADAAADAAPRPGRQPLRAPATLRALLRLAFSPGFGTGSPRPPPAWAGPATRLPPAFELLVLACAAESEADAARAHLCAAASACERCARGEPPEPQLAAALAATPIAAAGCVAWTRRELGGGDAGGPPPPPCDAVRAALLAGAPLKAYVALLALVAQHCPGAAPEVCAALGAALRAAGRTDTETSPRLLELAPVLLRAGCVEPLLEAVEAWAPHADPSIVRAFVASALAVAAPPYSRRFAAAMLRICVLGKARRSDSKAVDEFATACRGAGLAEEEARLLCEL